MALVPIIDADAHISEAPDTWTARLPKKWHDLAPQVVTDNGGTDWWCIGDKQLTPVGATAVAGWEKPFPSMPPTYERMHAGAHNTAARLAYMDSQGIWAQLMYPNVGGFGSQAFLEIDNDELKLASVRAYNDWISEWCAESPDRLLASAAMPFWDLEESVAEVHRCAEMGHRTVLFTGEPHRFDQPFLGDRHWDPLWQASVDTDMPVSLHIGSADFFGGFTPDRLAAHGVTPTVAQGGLTLFMQNGIQLGDVLLCGMLPRNPHLKVVSVESGMGFVPFVLESLDYLFEQAAVRNEKPEFELKPSEYFARQVYTTVFFEDSAPQRMLDLVGEDNVLFETDFPHPSCLFDNVQDTATHMMRGHADDIHDKVLFGNSQRIYNVAPATDAWLATL